MMICLRTFYATLRTWTPVTLQTYAESLNKAIFGLFLEIQISIKRRRAETTRNGGTAGSRCLKATSQLQ